MRRLLVAILFLTLGRAGPAAALDPGRADGSLSVGQANVALKAAYAAQYLNEEGLADAPELRLLLADRKVDPELLSGPTADAVERAARKGQLRGILLRLDPVKLGKAPVRGTLLMPPKSYGDPLVHVTITADPGGFEALRVGKDRVVGTAQFSSTGGDGPVLAYRSVFSAPLLQDRPSARLIGQRAQESPQAMAVLAFERALIGGDLATVSAHTTAERFSALDADVARLGAALFYDQVRAQIPDPTLRQRQIREVVIHGRRAWVVMTNNDGTRTIAALAHQDGEWRVD